MYLFPFHHSAMSDTSKSYRSDLNGHQRESNPLMGTDTISLFPLHHSTMFKLPKLSYVSS